MDLGFGRRPALTVHLALPAPKYAANADVITFYDVLRHRLQQLPGVQSVGATRLLPLTGTIGDWSITIEGHDSAPGDNPNGDWQVVTPGYLETMGVRLVRGRTFEEADRADMPPVAVVNETMAARYWPNASALGKRFHLGTMAQPWITIVGVVGQVHHNAVTEAARAEMYMPHAQWAVDGASTPRGG